MSASLALLPSLSEATWDLDLDAKVQIVNPTLIVDSDLSKLPLDKLPLNLLPLDQVKWSDLQLPDINNVTINIPPSGKVSIVMGLAQLALSLHTANKQNRALSDIKDELYIIAQKLNIIDLKLNLVAEALADLDRRVWKVLFSQSELPARVHLPPLLTAMRVMELDEKKYRTSRRLLRENLNELRAKILTVLHARRPSDLVPVSLALSYYLNYADQAGIDVTAQLGVTQDVRDAMASVLAVDESKLPVKAITALSPLSEQLNFFEGRIREELQAVSLSSIRPPRGCTKMGSKRANKGKQAYREPAVDLVYTMGLPSYSWTLQGEDGLILMQVGDSENLSLCFSANYSIVSSDDQTTIRQHVDRNVASEWNTARLLASNALVDTYAVVRLNEAGFSLVNTFHYIDAVGAGTVDGKVSGGCQFVRKASNHNRASTLSPVIGNKRVEFTGGCVYGAPAAANVRINMDQRGRPRGPIAITLEKANVPDLVAFAKAMRVRPESRRTTYERSARAQVSRANEDLERIAALVVVSRFVAEAMDPSRISWKKKNGVISVLRNTSPRRRQGELRHAADYHARHQAGRVSPGLPALAEAARPGSAGDRARGGVDRGPGILSLRAR